MKHEIHAYALFDDRNRAMAAYQEVQERGCREDQCAVVLHEGFLDEADLLLSETAVREGARKGAVVLGGAGAVIAGLAALGGGLFGIGPLAAAAFGAGTGAAYGGLLGAISGASDPDKVLRKIEKQVAAGKILLAVETEDMALRDACASIFAAHGGSSVE